jgi:anaerobic magnesium-protoporphyrin IX monomethyl ester cyclase
MKVLLIFPPQWDTACPYSSVPSLTAFLKSKGINAVQRDLNIEVYDLFTNKDFLKESSLRVRDKFEILKKKESLTAEEKGDYKELLKSDMVSEFVLNNIEDAKKLFSTGEVMPSIDKIIDAMAVLNSALRMTYSLFGPINLRSNYVWPPYITFKKQDAEEIITAAYDDEHNLFRYVFKHYFLDSILAEKPDVIGISVTAYEQIIAAFTLAALIKERQPGIHVTLGGNTYSAHPDVLAREKRFFDIIDSVVLQEGEISLLRLVETVDKQEGSLEDVPGLVYRAGGETRFNPLPDLLDVSSLPTPDFKNFPLDLYMTPRDHLAFPLQTSRGCYWGRCTFCDEPFRYRKYRPREIDRVIEDCVKIEETYGSSLFIFGDSAISPARLKLFAEKVLDRGMDIEWILQARPEGEFTPELCSLLAEAGCRQFYWGVESICDRILDLMDKGTNKNEIINVLTNSKKAGILNHCYMMFGFPTEDSGEAKETLTFLLENRGKIDTLSAAEFMLLKHCKVEESPESFHITELISNREDYGRGWDYKVDRGMSQQETRQILGQFHRVLKQVYPEMGLWSIVGVQHTQQALGHGSHFEKPGYLQLEECKDWRKTYFKMKDSAFLKEVRPDIGKEGKTRGNTYALYDADARKLILIRQTIADVLELANNGRCAADIGTTLSKEYEISPQEARETLLTITREINDFIIVEEK